MKSLFVFLLLGTIINTVPAQNAALSPATSTPNLYLHPNPDIVDTSSIKKLSDKFYIAKARQDNMPILLPGGTGRTMPNATRPQAPHDRMPNLWKKPTQDLKALPRSATAHDLLKRPQQLRPPANNSKKF